MRTDHLDALRPRCPLCRERGEESPLTLATIAARADDGAILEGMLHCSAASCRREYPILDGVPVIVGPLRAFLAEAQSHALLRDDLSPDLASAIGDCLGPGSAFDTARQQPGCYAWDHWADRDPEEAAPDEHSPRPGAALRALERGLALAASSPATAPPDGPSLDLGPAAGRTTFALAERFPGLALGVDLHLGMARLAQRILRTGEVRYARRRVGIVYDPRRFDARLAPDLRARVDFWACDALALPFAAGTFARASALNVLDCVRSPKDLLAGLARVLRPGAPAVLTTPYDWSTAATPLESWLGGHSQRGPDAGASEPVLRALLDATSPDSYRVKGLALESELASLPWQVRIHDRAVMTYRAHLLVLRSAALPPGA